MWRAAGRETPGRLARTASAAAALAPKGRELADTALAIAVAVPPAYLTLASRKRAMAKYGQTASGVAEDALLVAAKAAVVAMAVGSR